MASDERVSIGASPSANARRWSGPSRIVVLGGGLAGAAAAYALALAGWRDVTIVERGAELGGLAGSFEREGRFYPLGYHHILHRDRTLLFFLDRIGALPRVRWRKIRMLFNVGGRMYDLGAPGDFARFPMHVMDKLRFVRLMLRAFRKHDWSEWEGRSARELIDTWAGPGVRHAIFEPLSRLKFERPCEEISAAWLGARLHFREGSAPLGYIPGANWTKILCDGVTKLLEKSGVRLRLRARIAKLDGAGDRITAAVLEDGSRVDGDVFVSTVPTEIFTPLIGTDTTPHLHRIRYTALISTVCATRQPVPLDFYWMNLASLDRRACGIFKLNALNPTIGGPGETCINFVTHLQSRDDPFFARPPTDLLETYRADFRAIFGFELEPFWSHTARVAMYSPIFTRDYRNPPGRSTTWRNLYFAGNYRTFPSVASTGTAMASGLQTAQDILTEAGQTTDLREAAATFRLRSMPRGAVS